MATFELSVAGTRVRLQMPDNEADKLISEYISELDGPIDAELQERLQWVLATLARQMKRIADASAIRGAVEAERSRAENNRKNIRWT